MRKILCFLAVLPLFSISKANYSTKAIKFGITSISLSPVYSYGKSYFSLEIRASELQVFEVEVHLENDLYSNISLLSKRYTSYEKALIEYDNKFTRTNNKIVIKQTDLINKTVQFYQHDLEISSEIPSLIKNDTYTSTKIIYCYKNGRWNETHETLSLEGFEHLYSPNYYHKIDFNDFKIHLDSELGKLRYSKASLLISNRNGVFDALEHDSIYAHINLKLKEIDSEIYCFEFARQMYVNRHNLRMFESYQNNCVKTNHFYLPINEKRYEEEYDCFLVIESIGIDDAKLSHEFKLKTQKNIVGDCLNSEFCVLRS